eukprot:scaffold23195_cov76-Phaeocystis_antarctica.AAC.3
MPNAASGFGSRPRLGLGLGVGPGGRIRGRLRAVDLGPWSGFEGHCSHARPGCGTSARASAQRRRNERTPHRSRPRALTR